MTTVRHGQDSGVAGSSGAVPAALLRDVVRCFQPLRIILFGSAGRGEAGTDSDLDLAVILPDDAPASLLHWRAVNEARRGHDIAVDILPFRLSAFTAAQVAFGTLPWIIARDGQEVWEREPASHDGWGTAMAGENWRCLVFGIWAEPLPREHEAGSLTVGHHELRAAGGRRGPCAPLHRRAGHP